MSYEIKGKLVFIGPLMQVTDTFSKKEFAIELNETGGDRVFTSYVKMQLTQAKTTLLNGYGIGDEIKCQFNLRGSKSIKNGVTNYFTNIEAWKIEREGAAQPAGVAYQQRPVQQSDIPQGEESDSLPF